MTVDGITNLDTGSNGTVHSMPSMDSIMELKVLSAYTAEVGRNSGGTITVVTKGGSKKINGSANWYYRHEDLNANDYFANLAGRPVTPYRYNIASYTIGGPVVLPKINRSRSKLFFFWSQEFQHQLRAYGVKTITLPTALERKGDFSQSYTQTCTTWPAPCPSNTLIQVRDPLNNKTQFPGNVIPAARFNPWGQAILNMMPLPNYVDPQNSRHYQWNYYTSEAGAYPRRTESARVDYSPRPNWQIFGRGSLNSDQQHVPYNGCCDAWVTGSLNYDVTPIVYSQPGRDLVIHSTNVVSSFGVINDFFVGASQNTLTYLPQDPSKMDRVALGITIPQRNPSLNPLNLIPNMTFSNQHANPVNLSMSDGTPYWNRNTIYQVSDNVSRIWGTHTVKAGVSFERTRKVQFANAAVRGTVSFQGQDGNNVWDAYDAFANALIGSYDTYAEATGRPKGDYHFGNNEFYVMDTWRARRNLSVEYGLRFYHDPPQYDAHHILSTFWPPLYDPANAPVLLRPGYDASGTKVAIDPRNGNTYSQGLIALFAPNSGNPANGMFYGGKNGYPEGLYTMPALAGAPRFSFAWSPGQSRRTAIRGGIGVFYDRLEGNPTMGQLTNPPTMFTPTQYYGQLADIPVAAKSGLIGVSSASSLAGNGHIPTVVNYSLGFQRQIGHSLIADVSYSGNFGRHLIWERDLNTTPIGTNILSLHPENRDPTSSGSGTVLNSAFLRPYKGYSQITFYEFAGTSNYNAVLASLQKRFSHGLDFGLSYTFSKALDTADGYGSWVSDILPPRARNYGPAGYDRSQVFTARYTYRLPKVTRLQFKPLRKVLDDWELSGVTRLITGAPITLTGINYNTYVDVTGSTNAGDGARVSIGDPNAPAVSRFIAPQQGTLGNSGKGILRGPGTNNWDMALDKAVTIYERLQLHLRFETYNTFNHTQFSSLSTSERFQSAPTIAGGPAIYNNIDPLFLQPTAARPSRKCQIAVRLKW
jgi:hypothetical protein